MTTVGRQRVNVFADVRSMACDTVKSIDYVYITKPKTNENSAQTA